MNKGIIYYTWLENACSCFCDKYKCSSCPIGNEVCQKSADAHFELAEAVRNVLERLGLDEYAGKEEIAAALQEGDD